MQLIDLSPEQVETYHANGYVIVKHFCSAGEAKKLSDTAIQDKVLQESAMDFVDRFGGRTKLFLWYKPGDDVFGYLTRSEKMINSVYQLLDSDAPVCVFHTKVLQKEPRIGGAWEWHQDYGYWYKNQFMFPDQLISVMIALQPESKENGCLQVIKGSHKLGRIDHTLVGEMNCADMVMVNNALKTMEVEYIELDAGDAIFFHSNLLHCSSANLSDRTRQSLISCYCSETNLAYNEQSVSWHTPVIVVENEAILQREAQSLSAQNFLTKENDPALKQTGRETAAGFN